MGKLRLFIVVLLLSFTTTNLVLGQTPADSTDQCANPVQDITITSAPSGQDSDISLTPTRINVENGDLSPY